MDTRSRSRGRMATGMAAITTMIEVRSNTRRVRIIYDTPYIRSLPTRLEVTDAGPLGPVTKSFGPLYGDAFSNELETFHRHIMPQNTAQ